MIAADELNMIDNGEYVFFNIEIFGSLTKEAKPWFEPNDTDTRNEQAKKAYQALLTITTKKPEDEEYQEFSNQVISLKFQYFTRFNIRLAGQIAGKGKIQLHFRRTRAN